jgi:putative phosphoribosyl transferase
MFPGVSFTIAGVIFKNRKEAAQKLAAALIKYKNRSKTIAIGLPRGGVVVAAEVAKALHIPLDIVVPRKIGSPLNEELAIGALAGDVVWLDKEIIAAVGASSSYIEQTIAKEMREAERRLALFRKGKAPQNFTGCTVILIDDGIATGATMRASIAWMKKSKAQRIIVAVPVGPPDTLAALGREVDEIVCLFSPESFMAVGQFYEHFPQTQDSEVIEALK